MAALPTTLRSVTGISRDYVPALEHHSTVRSTYCTRDLPARAAGSMQGSTSVPLGTSVSLCTISAPLGASMGTLLAGSGTKTSAMVEDTARTAIGLVVPPAVGGLIASYGQSCQLGSGPCRQAF